MQQEGTLKAPPRGALLHVVEDMLLCIRNGGIVLATDTNEIAGVVAPAQVEINDMMVGNRKDLLGKVDLLFSTQ